MKVVCICGSARNNGSTSRILAEMCRAFEESGHDISQYFIGDLNIDYCCGQMLCELDGRCVKNDDVLTIVNDISTADLVIVASPSYWGDVTGQLKVFIDRCTPYCNMNPSRNYKPSGAKGIAVAIRAGQSKQENENLVATIEHFLGHLDIPLFTSFTAEGIGKLSNLESKPEILIKAYEFALSLIIT